MFKLNDNSIFSGYIKQLLNNFYLPQIQILNRYNIKNIYLKTNKYYILNNQIIQYTGVVNKIDNINKLQYKFIDVYKFGKQIKINNNINYSKNLILQNLEYDIYTHQFLGEYLRCLKYNKNINLMSLYNCFCENVALNVDFSIGSINFNSSNDKYNLYAIPIKYFEQYTIAIDSSLPIEFICAKYNKFSSTLYINSYKKYNYLQFSKPILYNPNINEDIDKLFLIVKIPVNVQSSIVILEGDYRNYNNRYIDNDNVGYQNKYNYSVINFEDGCDINNIPLIFKCQLLNINNQNNYVFSDKLISYLLNYNITNIDSIQYNIKLLQDNLLNNYKNKDIGIKNVDYEGLWEDKYKGLIYNISLKKGLQNKYFDILGYVDNNNEKYIIKDLEGGN